MQLEGAGGAAVLNQPRRRAARRCLARRVGDRRVVRHEQRADVPADDGRGDRAATAHGGAGSASRLARLATLVQGATTPRRIGCRDSTADNYSPLAEADDGSCIHMGCTDSASPAYSARANFDDGSCGPSVEGCGDPRAENYLPHARSNRSDACVLRGCTSPDAVNYDPSATVDDNSCVPRRYGCTDRTAANYASSATDDDGSCYIRGCTDSRAPNYDPLATADDHTCEVVLGCTDANGADNYNPLASVDDGSCVYVGCTSSAAINFAANATVDDGRCEHLPDAFAAFAWQLPRTVAPLVFNDGAIRRFTFAARAIPTRPPCWRWATRRRTSAARRARGRSTCSTTRAAARWRTRAAPDVRRVAAAAALRGRDGDRPARARPPSGPR